MIQFQVVQSKHLGPDTFLSCFALCFVLFCSFDPSAKYSVEHRNLFESRFLLGWGVERLASVVISWDVQKSLADVAPHQPVLHKVLHYLKQNFRRTFSHFVKFNILNIMPLKKRKRGLFIGNDWKEGNGTGAPLISHPWPPKAHSQLAEELTTDGMLITTLGTWLGSVQTLFSVSWLLILVEVIGIELGLKVSYEQARQEWQKLSLWAGIDHLGTFPLPYSVWDKTKQWNL